MFTYLSRGRNFELHEVVGVVCTGVCGSVGVAYKGGTAYKGGGDTQLMNSRKCTSPNVVVVTTRVHMIFTAIYL